MRLQQRYRLRNAIIKHRPKLDRFMAFLGDPTRPGVVDVDGRPGYVYVHFADETIMVVRNARVPSIYRLPVIIGRDPANPGILQVLAASEVEMERGGFYEIPNHAKSHERYGYDAVWISSEQITPWLVKPVAGSVSVYVYPGVYRDGSVYRVWPGGNVDLSGYKPANGAYFALLSYSPSSGIVVTTGSVKAAREELSIPDIPTAPSGSSPIFAVRLYAGQTEIRDVDGDSDLVDLRFGGVWSGWVAGGVGAMWGSIKGTLSDQTDLQSALDGKAPVNHTHTSVVGEAVMLQNYDITANKVWEDTGLSITLPEAGRYFVGFSARVGFYTTISTTTTLPSISIRLFDVTTGSAIANSEVRVLSASATGTYEATGATQVLISVAGPTTIRLEAYRIPANYSSARVISNDMGRTRLWYQKVG